VGHRLVVGIADSAEWFAQGMFDFALVRVSGREELLELLRGLEERGLLLRS
jgi:hypothetical protein